MPHAFIKTKLKPLELIEIWEETSFQLENVRIKIHKGYSNLDNIRAIFPCLVIESQHKNWFYIEVNVKEENRLFIHIDLITQVQRTAGVRLALAWFVHNVAQLDKNSQIEVRNLAAYFQLLSKSTTDQVKKLAWLQKKLFGQIHAAQRREQSKKYTISLFGLNSPLYWEKIFGNKNPVEIEIGPGKGKFILNEAGKNPQKNYLVIEWDGRYLKVISEKLPMAMLENVRLLDADAREVFKDWLSEASIAALHVYYPDPWWKRKHKKHKLFTKEFLSNVERVLQKNGILNFITDVDEIYQELLELIQINTSLKIMNKNIFRNGENPPPGRTNFEIKKWQNGSDIFEAKWQKVSE
jgi:tRNA (guanine-N7-)-methyltransferase